MAMAFYNSADSSLVYGPVIEGQGDILGEVNGHTFKLNDGTVVTTTGAPVKIDLGEKVYYQFTIAGGNDIDGGKRILEGVRLYAFKVGSTVHLVNLNHYNAVTDDNVHLAAGLLAYVA